MNTEQFNQIVKEQIKFYENQIEHLKALLEPTQAPSSGEPEKEEEICHWKKDFDGYNTDCGYTMKGYNPNAYKLCKHCGKPIKVQER